MSEGLLSSVFTAIDRPGQIVRNVIKGRNQSALRHLGQLGLDSIDAFLPGDWLRNDLATEEDDVSGSDLVNIDREKSPWLATAADLGFGILTDPLTYTGFGPILKGLKAGVGGAKSLAVAGGFGETVGALEKVGSTAARNVRSVFDAQRLSPLAQGAKEASLAAKSGVGKAWDMESRRIFGGLDEAHRRAVSDVFDNIQWDDAGKAVGVLDKPLTTMTGTFEDIGEQVTRLKGRIAKLPGVQSGALDVEKLTQAVDDVAQGGARQYREAVGKGIMGLPEEEAIRMHIYGKPQAADLERITRTPKDYLQRQFTHPEPPPGFNDIQGGNASFLKKRKITTDDQLLSAVTQDGVGYERDALKRFASRGQQQASAAGRVEIGKAIDGSFGNLADEATRGRVKMGIESMAKTDPESAKLMLSLFQGLPPRGPVLDVLSKVNHVVKPMMVYGYVIPKVGSIVRNKIGGVWQAFSNPESRGTALSQMKRIPSDLTGAVLDSIGVKGKDQLGQAIGHIDEAFMGARGLADDAYSALAKGPGAGGFTGQQLSDIARSGALDGFVTAEGLVKEMAASPWKKKYQNIADWPGRMFRGVEDRMRLGMIMDLTKQGKTIPEAAKIASDSLYNYGVSSVGNRTARDIIPFFQFMGKAIPQQAKLLNEKPWLAVGLASLMRAQKDEVYPYMEGSINLPLGKDEEGNPKFLSSLGLPLDVLNNIPNPSGSIGGFGRDLEREVVGASQPLLKTAYSAVSGREPFFGSQYGSYSKLPGNIEAGAFGRFYNQLSGTGLTQPIDAMTRPLLNLVDDRRSGVDKLVNNLTGARILSVDPDRARLQRLREDIERNPEIQQAVMPYSKSDDPATQALLNAYRTARKNARKPVEDS